MASIISVDDAIYGLVWCVAAADFKNWGFLKGRLIADQELAYLQYIIIEKNLNLSDNIKLTENGSVDLIFYNMDGYKKNEDIWKDCCESLKSEKLIFRVRSIAYMFEISQVLKENSEVFNNQLTGSKKEFDLIYRTINALNISKAEVSAILKGEEPELICSTNGAELFGEIRELNGLSDEIAGSVMATFSNSYQLSKASIKDFLGIQGVSIREAITLHEHFSRIMK